MDSLLYKLFGSGSVGSVLRFNHFKINTHLFKQSLTYFLMKSINETFEEREIEKLEKKKGDLTWHDFILKLIDYKEEKK